MMLTVQSAVVLAQVVWQKDWCRSAALAKVAAVGILCASSLAVGQALQKDY